MNDDLGTWLGVGCLIWLAIIIIVVAVAVWVGGEVVRQALEQVRP